MLACGSSINLQQRPAFIKYKSELSVDKLIFNFFHTLHVFHIFSAWPLLFLFHVCVRRRIVTFSISGQCTHFIPSWKQEIIWFSGVFRGCKNGAFARNRFSIAGHASMKTQVLLKLHGMIIKFYISLIDMGIAMGITGVAFLLNVFCTFNLRSVSRDMFGCNGEII